MDSNVLQGTVIRGIGSFYTVRDKNGNEYILRCKKKFRREHMSPLTGDEVMFTPGDGEMHGWLEEILPRKTICLRPPVANVTHLIIVIAPVPEADLLLTDRMIVRAAGQGMKVTLAVNKNDLDPGLADKLRAEYAESGIGIAAVSALTGFGLENLRNRMRGELCCMTGQSGAGKSTLLNALLGLNLETGDISHRIARGKNTTRHAELIVKNDICVMDTAGFSLLEPERDMRPEMLKERYPEFINYEGKCRFRECLHDREPGCAVDEASRNGEINPARLKRYRELLSELRESWRERYD